MKQKLLPIFVLFTAILSVIMILSILGSTNTSAIAAGQNIDQVRGSTPAGVLAEPATIITVTSGTDPDEDKSTTCYSGSSATSPCTLRHAINEARNVPESGKPVLIKFDIPKNAAEGYVSSLDIWKIQVYPTFDTYIFRELNGQIIIDGSTQPGGRSDGPKIIIVGPGTGNKDGLRLSSFLGLDANEIKGLGFQNLRTYIFISTNNNLVKDNWFGLTDNGQDAYLTEFMEDEHSGGTAIAVSANMADNIIENNVFLGLYETAATIRGEANTFSMNFVGTTSDGTVPGKQTDPDLVCSKVDWLGGGAVTLEGDDHVIENNIIAGIRLEISKYSTQPTAIYVGGDGHLIQDNLIGVDSADKNVGVCGRGIYIGNGPQNNRIVGNTIVNPGFSGISLNDVLYDANTLEGNIIKRNDQWPQIEGNPAAEDAIQLGPILPNEFVTFKPAEIKEIDGTTVKGGSGENSPCAGCRIELFLDDTDLITEALQSLDVVTAGSDGKWTATIPSKLSASQGIRTTSTSMKYNTIPNMSSGTTTGLSILYTESGGPGGGNQLFMPMVVNKD